MPLVLFLIFSVKRNPSIKGIVASKRKKLVPSYISSLITVPLHLFITLYTIPYVSGLA